MRWLKIPSAFTLHQIFQAAGALAADNWVPLSWSAGSHHPPELTKLWAAAKFLPEVVETCGMAQKLSTINEDHDCCVCQTSEPKLLCQSGSGTHPKSRCRHQCNQTQFFELVMLHTNCFGHAQTLQLNQPPQISHSHAQNCQSGVNRNQTLELNCELAQLSRVDRMCADCLNWLTAWCFVSTMEPVCHTTQMEPLSSSTGCIEHTPFLHFSHRNCCE